MRLFYSSVIGGEAVTTTELLVLMFGPAGVVTVVAGALAYAWKRSADTKFETVQREAQEAKEQAQQFTALTSSINRLAEAWDRSSLRADDERKEFARIVEQNAVAKSELANAVTDTNTQLKSLPDVFKAGAHEAVKRVNDAMDTRFKETNEANGRAFREVKEEISALREKIDKMLEIVERQWPPAAEPVSVEVAKPVTVSVVPDAEPKASDGE